MKKIALCGACGRMGKRIIKTVTQEKDLKLASAIDEPDTEHEGKDAGKIANIDKLDIEVVGGDRLKEELEKTNTDVLVDFTVADASIQNVKAAADQEIPVVVGTTGFSEKQKKELEQTVQDANIRAVISTNMSLGVNVFFRIVENVAEILSEYDMELIEKHHNKKKDAPSGTALTAAELVAKATDRDLEEVAKFGREKGDIGERSEDEIGIHSIRGGNIAGDHEFIFAGPNERLEIIHRAQSRQAFVDGVLKAIRKMEERGAPGTIVGMQEVLFMDS